MSVSLSDMFEEFSNQGFVLYKLFLDPLPRDYTICSWKEPAAIKIESGWREKLSQNYLNTDVGKITHMEPLTTLSAILAEGTEYTDCMKFIVCQNL